MDRAFLSNGTAIAAVVLVLVGNIYAGITEQKITSAVAGE